jgi:flagellar biogenesis protein FliO
MTASNTTNNIVASAAVTSPMWLPWLQDFSALSALLLPIAGLSWLVIQIIGYIHKYNKGN